MSEKLQKLEDNLNSVIKGKSECVDLLLICLCAGGNVLLEDVPGVGKTTLAKALARSIDARFNRVQFTPDLLPSDILGCSIYNPKEGTFNFNQGPIFCNIFLADEINRASPRTQSALLEAMNEKQVSIEGKTYPLAPPFLVIATENPVEYQGTYSLPEAQLDRFAMQLSLGYPDNEAELEVLYSRQGGDPLDDLTAVMNCEEVVELQNTAAKITIEKSIAVYAGEIIRMTRENENILLGASPRALLTLCRCAQARAMLADRDFVVPDDIRELAAPVLAHRIALDNRAKYSGVDKVQIINEIVEKCKLPN